MTVQVRRRRALEVLALAVMSSDFTLYIFAQWQSEQPFITIVVGVKAVCYEWVQLNSFTFQLALAGRPG